MPVPLPSPFSQAGDPSASGADPSYGSALEILDRAMQEGSVGKDDLEKADSFSGAVRLLNKLLAGGLMGRAPIGSAGRTASLGGRGVVPHGFPERRTTEALSTPPSQSLKYSDDVPPSMSMYEQLKGVSAPPAHVNPPPVLDPKFYPAQPAATPKFSPAGPPRQARPRSGDPRLNVPSFSPKGAPALPPARRGRVGAAEVPAGTQAAAPAQTQPRFYPAERPGMSMAQRQSPAEVAAESQRMKDLAKVALGTLTAGGAAIGGVAAASKSKGKSKVSLTAAEKAALGD